MTPLPRAFKQVDVFTGVPFLGNPVAVVLDAEGLDTEQMQRIANWTNLSETTFVLAATEPEADYQVRIFTPASELPFAGHPTIGTAHALLEAGRIKPRGGVLVQQCRIGLVKVSVTGNDSADRVIAFELPNAKVEPLSDTQVDELEGLLGQSVDRSARPRLVDVGARWIVAQLTDADAVIAARPDMERMKAQDTAARATGVVIFGAYPPGSPTQVELRAFAPTCGIAEDPVCGSGNGCMAAFVRDTGQVERFGSTFIVTQGQVLGRAGRLLITVGTGAITVGGQSVTCVSGALTDAWPQRPRG